ncbi:hypothetical protein EYF80_055958 [Liparis tanakae]|uniref:Uncharacterized protein n=1 Tax=Liparis tanakae TaxID=230148 RepID=A0A4Z2EYB2_9TELE|nr:hypothetical protein EYF80_055958 [Liparis tanakae]
MPMEKALGDSRQSSHTSGWGKSSISTVNRDRQPSTTVSMEPTVLASLGLVNSGVSMKEKEICGSRRSSETERRETGETGETGQRKLQGGGGDHYYFNSKLSDALATALLTEEIP